MDEIESMVVHLAETCRTDEIIDVLEDLSTSQNKKSIFFFQVGIIFYKFSYFDLSLLSLNRSLHYSILDEDRYGESACYTNLGNTYYRLGEYKKAITYHERALKIKKELKDTAGESECYTNIGIVLNSMGDAEEAITYLRRALQIDKELKDTAGESKCYTNLGNAYHNLGNVRKAITYHKKALKIKKELKDTAGESKCYTNLGNACHNLGDFAEALEYFEKALEICEEIKDKVGESRCYSGLGNTYFSLGEYKKAVQYHERALHIDRKIEDTAGESKCYINLGNAYDGLGELKKAIRHHEKALKICKEIGDKARESICYTNLGDAYYGLSNFRKALEYHEKALEINKEIKDKSGESACYTSLGNIHNDVGDVEKAVQCHEKALEIDRQMGDKSGESTCYINLGVVYHGRRDFAKAVEYYREALKICKEIGDKARESTCYTNLGNIYRSLRDFEKALKYLRKALKIKQEIKDRAGELICYANLGAAYRSLGNFEKAVQYHEKALHISRKIGDIESERVITLNIGKMYFKSSPESSYDYCKRSIELSELIIGNLVEEQFKIGFHAKAVEVFQHIVPLCLKLKKTEEAFEYTEKSKSRAFLDVLAATEINPTREATELELLLDKEEEYLARLREIQMCYLKPTRILVEPGEVEQIYENLTQIYNQIEQYDPEYVFIRRGDPLSFTSLRNMLLSQKKDIVLIEYFITRDRTHIFVISSRDNQLHIKSVPLPGEALTPYLGDWRKIAIFPGVQNMSSFLIEPVSEYIAKDDLLYFVPYGPLHYLPLHALQLRGEPVVKKHPVAYLPSASLFQFFQNKGSGSLQSCASFGVAFEEEAERVAEIFSTRAYPRFSATKKNVETCNKDIIHLACHAWFNDEDPLSSGVLLHDGTLTARDILTMRLNTELVTLSACETGRSRGSLGDDLIGLTRAFIYAGAPSVIVSLWPVYNPPTQELMLEFYTQLKNGADKATALQKAQIKIMEKKEYSHPYFWAPFVLVGNWK